MDDLPASSLRREQLRPLLARRDGPGLVRWCVQSSLFLGSGICTILLVQAGHPGWLASVVLCGISLAFFFPSLHEAGHKTAFRTGAFNEICVWVSAVLMLQAPSFFRVFHWAHHRHTQDRELDPEIAAAPDMLAAWPRNPLVYLALASGQFLWVGKLMFTLSSALMPKGRLWERAFPFIRPGLRGRIAWESRLVLALLVGFCACGCLWVEGFAHVLWAWPIAHVVLGFYLMTEHTGLPHDGSQAHRTRSTRSSRLFEWLMWHMPYHAEHHIFPAVPFHALPALRRELGNDIEHEAPGYLRFHIVAATRSFARRARNS